MSNTSVNSMSLQGCIELFLDRCEAKNLSSATIKYYVENLGRFVRYLADKHNINNPVVQDFKVEYIKKYLSNLKAKPKWEDHATIPPTAKKIGSQSLRTYTRALRVFGNWLFKEEYIQEDILKKIELPQGEEKDREILTDEEIEIVLSTLNSKTEMGLRNTAIFLLTIDCGLRQKTIADLKVSDISFKQKTIRVSVKGNRITVLPLGNTVIQRLKEYIVKYRHLITDDNANLFVSISRKKLTDNAIKKCLPNWPSNLASKGYTATWAGIHLPLIILSTVIVVRN